MSSISLGRTEQRLCGSRSSVVAGEKIALSGRLALEVAVGKDGVYDSSRGHDGGEAYYRITVR